MFLTEVKNVPCEGLKSLHNVMAIMTSYQVICATDNDNKYLICLFILEVLDFDNLWLCYLKAILPIVGM